MLVQDVMSPQVHRVGPDRSVQDVAVEMHRLKIGAVIVMNDGEPVGIFTERDLLNRVVAMGTDPKAIPVSAVMTGKLMGVSPEATVEVAAILMHKRGFRHLPVMHNGKLVGILSVRDVLRALAPEGGARHMPRP
jgi:CBS domain-containing protein